MYFYIFHFFCKMVQIYIEKKNQVTLLTYSIRLSWFIIAQYMITVWSFSSWLSYLEPFIQDVLHRHKFFLPFLHFLLKRLDERRPSHCLGFHNVVIQEYLYLIRGGQNGNSLDSKADHIHTLSLSATVHVHINNTTLFPLCFNMQITKLSYESFLLR